MVFRLNDSAPRVTRHDLADPHRHVTLEERLAQIGAVDLRANIRVVDQGDGYASIQPVDPARQWTANVTPHSAMEPEQRPICRRRSDPARPHARHRTRGD